MSLRAYSEINLHVVWHVKHNEPVLQDEIEMQLHRYLRGRAMETPASTSIRWAEPTTTSTWL